jgi:aspartyl protease family protein
VARLYVIIVGIGLLIGFLMPDRQAPIMNAETPQRRSVIDVKTASKVTQASAEVSGPWTTLRREDNGHFYARAQVNGQSVDFMIDTGASGVALTEGDARRLGIPLVTFDRVSLDGKTVERVPGAVLEGLEISLLGQTFLGRMGKIEITRDQMIIR